MVDVLCIVDVDDDVGIEIRLYFCSRGIILLRLF